MAPLAGYTCYPFRMLAYEMGAGLCFTEMSSANALKYQDRATRRLLFTTPEEPVKAVQLLGGPGADRLIGNIDRTWNMPLTVFLCRAHVQKCQRPDQPDSA